MKKNPCKVALVSNCGFWEIDNFDPMLVSMQAYCKNGGEEFVGALLRSQGPALRPMMEMGAPMDDIFEAAKDAGRQLVREGEMSEKTLKVVNRNLMPLEMYVQTVNERFQKTLDALENK